MKFSLYKKSTAEIPEEALSIEKFIDGIKSGRWQKSVEKLREQRNDIIYRKQKSQLPAVSMSGEFTTRAKEVELKDKLIKHSGLICIDVDKKDNVKMRVQDLVDKDCLAQFISCSGEGIKIVYRCLPVKDAAQHRRIYDAITKRLESKKVKLKVDPIVKSISSLQYVSYDPSLYYNPKTKLVIQPLPPVRIKQAKPSEDKLKDLEELNTYIEALNGKDITKDYEDWMRIAFGLSYSLGESGRAPFLKLSEAYKDFNENEANEKYDACLEKSPSDIEKPVTLATVFQIINENLPKVKLRHLAKKYNKGHAVGIGEDVEQGDLSGMVRYKLFLFKKEFDKETNTLVELIPTKLNYNAFETLLRQKNFYRFGKMFVYIQENIVEEVDLNDIIRIVTAHIESEGDYVFTYNKIEYQFSWEEIAHLWRQIRAQSNTYNQIMASLEHWVPNLLKDNATESFIPYRNGVVKVTAKGFGIIPYKNMDYQIWKERILPRDFTYDKTPGMFEHFFANVAGRGKNFAERIKSKLFKRSVWYFGYMLHGTKRQSTARAWLLYDIKTGNNGRSGKTIVGNAIGKIRSVVALDGKQIDFTNRFAFQTVTPWTDVVFIDDPSKFMSLNPLFNMISGDLSADRKGLNPVIKSVKFMIASNWVLEVSGESETGRQFVTQFDDFYVRYSKDHNNTITPIVDLHGKEFFTDWDGKDWAQFDSFAVRSLQCHLGSEVPDNTIVGNAATLRFIQSHGEELEYELTQALKNNLVKIKEGGNRDSGYSAIVVQILTNIVREHDENCKASKAAKIVREWLRGVGINNPELTTIKSGGMVKTAYKFKNDLGGSEAPT